MGFVYIRRVSKVLLKMLNLLLELRIGLIQAWQIRFKELQF